MASSNATLIICKAGYFSAFQANAASLGLLQLVLSWKANGTAQLEGIQMIKGKLR
jgi:hypothetical protein